jgi:hypothetical protein
VKWVAKRPSASLRETFLYEVRHVLERNVSKYSTKNCRLKPFFRERRRHIRFKKSTGSEGIHLKYVCWHTKDDGHLFMVMHNPPATKGVVRVDEALCA